MRQVVVASAMVTLAVCWSALADSAISVVVPGGGESYTMMAPPASVEALRRQFSAQQIDILEALNRADAAHLVSLPTLVVPTDWNDDVMSYSPFPARLEGWYPDRRKLLVLHQPGQAFAAYEDRQLIRWGPVSSGREAHPTPRGLFSLNWKSRGRHSTVNEEWYMPWYFNFANFRGLSLHELSLPGKPASHACVRLLERDALWLYDWGESWTLGEQGQTVLREGTPFLIVGCYRFDQPPPWRAIPPPALPIPADPQFEHQNCDGR